jgi:hypothetical protein
VLCLPISRDGARPLEGLDDRRSDGLNGQVFREHMAADAVILGRRTFGLAGRRRGDRHDG